MQSVWRRSCSFFHRKLRPVECFKLSGGNAAVHGQRPIKLGIQPVGGLARKMYLRLLAKSFSGVCVSLTFLTVCQRRSKRFSTESLHQIVQGNTIGERPRNEFSYIKKYELRQSDLYRQQLATFSAAISLTCACFDILLSQTNLTVPTNKSIQKQKRHAKTSL